MNTGPEQSVEELVTALSCAHRMAFPVGDLE